MTSKELGEVLNLSEITIRRQWNRLCKSKEKSNIYLIRLGVGKNADYGIKLPQEDDYIFDRDYFWFID